MRRQILKPLLFSTPFLVLAFVIRGRDLINSFGDRSAQTAWVALVACVFVGVLTALEMRRQRNRAAELPGCLWHSKPAFFAGPYDDADDAALPGSARFAKKHQANAPVLIVRLALTESSLHIVSTRGRNEAMKLPLQSLQEIELVRGDRANRGIRVHLAVGRSGTFLVAPDDALADRLQALGAHVDRL